MPNIWQTCMIVVKVVLSVLFTTGSTTAIAEESLPVYVLAVDTSQSTTEELSIFERAITEILSDESVIQSLDSCQASLSFATWNNGKYLNTGIQYAVPKSDRAGVSAFLKGVREVFPTSTHGDTLPSQALEIAMAAYPQRRLIVLLFIDPKDFEIIRLAASIRKIEASDGIIHVLISRSGRSTRIISPQSAINIGTTPEEFLKEVREIFWSQCFVGM